MLVELQTAQNGKDMFPPRRIHIRISLKASFPSARCTASRLPPQNPEMLALRFLGGIADSFSKPLVQNRPCGLLNPDRPYSVSDFRCRLPFSRRHVERILNMIPGACGIGPDT